MLETHTHTHIKSDLRAMECQYDLKNWAHFFGFYIEFLKNELTSIGLLLYIGSGHFLFHYFPR